MIERFLKSTYTYNLDETKVPSEGEDFVDHFLFEQQYGYCDHFSTSMVIMLRSVGIPARWVKGFVPGDVVSTDNQSYSVIVRNSHAHSWVEGFFEGRGWVSFEPTPENASIEHMINIVDKHKSVNENRGWYGLAIGGVMGLYVIMIVVRKGFELLRMRTRLWWDIRQINRLGGRSDVMLRQFEKGWIYIQKRHGNVKSTQTIREYVKQLNLDPAKREAIEQFASMHESVRYDSKRKWIPKRKIIELWQQHT